MTSVCDLDFITETYQSILYLFLAFEDDIGWLNEDTPNSLSKSNIALRTGRMSARRMTGELLNEDVLKSCVQDVRYSPSSDVVGLYATSTRIRGSPCCGL